MRLIFTIIVVTFISGSALSHADCPSDGVVAKPVSWIDPKKINDLAAQEETRCKAELFALKKADASKIHSNGFPGRDSCISQTIKAYCARFADALAEALWRIYKVDLVAARGDTPRDAKAVATLAEARESATVNAVDDFGQYVPVSNAANLDRYCFDRSDQPYEISADASFRKINYEKMGADLDKSYPILSRGDRIILFFKGIL